MDKQQIMTWTMRLGFVLTEVFLFIMMIVSFAQTKSYTRTKDGVYSIPLTACRSQRVHREQFMH